MATFANRTSGTASGLTAETSRDTASVSLTTGGIVFVRAVIIYDSGPASASVASRAGVTWQTPIVLNESFGRQLVLFWGYVTATSSAVVNIARGGTDSWSSINWSVDEALPGGGNTLDIVGANTVTTSESGVDPIVATYAQAMATGSSGYACACFYGDGRNSTPKSGWTELSDTPIAALQGATSLYIASTDTTAEATFGAGGNVRMMIAMEVSETAGGGGGSAKVYLPLLGVG